jgi:hypothetical protein
MLPESPCEFATIIILVYAFLKVKDISFSWFIYFEEE